MALFGRRSDDGVERVRIPAFYGDPVAAEVAAAAARGDLAVVDQAFRSSDLDRRALLVRAVGLHLDVDVAWRWVENAPQEATAWQVHASTLAGQARSARGTGRASEVRQGQVVDFVGGMAQARRSLGRVLELHPADPLALSEAVFTSYAGTREQIVSDVQALLDCGVIATDGLRTAVNLLGPKWFGSTEEAMGLARWVSENSPPGHDAHAVLAFAVSETFFHLRDFRNSPGEAAAWLASEQARSAVATARARGFGQPAHRPTPLTPRLRNDLAFACRLIGDDAGAAEQFAALDGLATSYPWSHPASPARAFARAWRASEAAVTPR